MGIDGLVIAAAQIAVVPGDVPANSAKHLNFIDMARNCGADYVIFPELSLTGYEPTLAEGLAFSVTDQRLRPLVDCCQRAGVAAVVGAPIRLGAGLTIGQFIILPSGQSCIYTKRHLHPGEERHFSPHDLNPVLAFGDDAISFAICADISAPVHPKQASENGATAYLASVLITPSGYACDTALLRSYASTYNMLVVMSNYVGTTGGHEAAGGSLAIDGTGRVLAGLNGTEESLLVCRRRAGAWEAMPVVRS